MPASAMAGRFTEAGTGFFSKSCKGQSGRLNILRRGRTSIVLAGPARVLRSDCGARAMLLRISAVGGTCRHILMPQRW